MCSSDLVISVVAWTNQKQGMSRRGKMGLDFPESARDGLPHQVLHSCPLAEAFFLPGTGLGRGKDNHGPSRATVAAEWVRVCVRVTRARVTPRVLAKSAPAA